MDGSDFIVADYRVPAPGESGVDFTVTLDGAGEYQCNCWLACMPCQHIQEVEAGMWHSQDPLVHAVDLAKREAGMVARANGGAS